MSKAEAVEVAELPAKDVRALVKQAEDKFRADIDDLLGRRKQMVGNLLQWRHDIGKVAARIVADRAKALHERTYGAHVVEDVAALLEETKDVIYACGHFAAMYGEKQLQEMQAKEWPWRGVLSLITVKDEKARDKFQKKWEDGKFKNTDELKDAIAEYNSEAVTTGIKTETRGRKKGVVTGPVKTADTIMTKFTSDTLPSLLKALEKAAEDDEMDEKKRETLHGHVEHIRELIPAMKQMLTDTEKAIKAAKL
jgi:hypothetical protein